MELFSYHNPLFLAKDLITAKQHNNSKLVNNINDWLIDLRNAIVRNKIPKNENPNKIVNIFEKIFDFNKQQKVKGIKILTPKQILERLPIAVAQIKAGNISENLLTEVRQIIYSLYPEKEVAKKIYNNIMNSINL